MHESDSGGPPEWTGGPPVLLTLVLRAICAEWHSTSRAGAAMSLRMKPEPIGNYISKWGEGPLWHQDRLLYVDIEFYKVLSLDPVSGVETVWDVGQRVGTVVPRASGGLVWAGERGIFTLDESTGVSTLIADPESEILTNRFNDGKCDSAGRLWAGTMDMRSPRSATGALYCLHGDHRIESKYGPVTVSNGLVWTRDGGTMYYIDTPRKSVIAFDFDLATGAITNERTAWDTSAQAGVPDGMTIDDQDRLWIAFCHGGKVVCWNPASGQIEGEVTFPTIETTACAFGGPGLKQLFVTTGMKSGEPLSGRVFVCEPGAAGVSAVAFAG
jgi:sugar lactone lactonase YvrE